MVQKTLVRPSFGTDFMPNCTNIAVFRVFVLDILTLFCIIAAYSWRERKNGGDDALYNVDNGFRKDVVTVVVLISYVLKILLVEKCCKKNSLEI